MPQMAPINWLMLFASFTILYILFTIINYFSSVPVPTLKISSISQTPMSPLNWKW